MSEEETPTPESKRRGLPRLLWGIIARPRATLEYVNERGGRTWWLPALLAIVLVILPVLVAAPITARQTREAIAAAQEQRFGGQEEMSPDEQAQMEQAMSIAASPFITAVFPAVGSVVVLAVRWLTWAGALYLAGMALGGRSTFGQMFRVVIWAWLPYALRGLLQTVYILLSGEAITHPGLSGLVQPDRPVAELVVSPPSPGQTVLAALLSRFDLFLIWNLVLLVIGVMVVTHLSRRKAILVTLGVWVLLTLLGLVPAFIGGFMAQQTAGF